MRFLLLLFVAVSANDHILTYVGFDHVLDYSPSTGNLRAFDFRRHLPSNDTCDFFVFPPLIESAKFIDVVTSAMPTANVEISYLGGEMFLVQDSASGSYTIRRCSGFMPQQTKIPCEVWSVGHDPSFLAPNRFFYAGDRKVVRYNSNSRVFDLLSFDQDVHGGGFPFGLPPLVSGVFSEYNVDSLISFSTVRINGQSFLISQDEGTGIFKIHKFKPSADTLESSVSPAVTSGVSPAAHRIKTLDENHVMVYDRTTGNFQIWKLFESDQNILIEVVKIDSIDQGNDCNFHDRQSCVVHPTCGWCEDSLTCHQLDINRRPCDHSVCSSIIDQYSPARKRFQRHESPIPGAVPEFGHQPAVNPVSPLRNSLQAASPILRSSDTESEKILDGVSTNPSDGIVFVPPRPATVPCMDDQYEDPKTISPPDVKAAEEKMNAGEGVAVPTSSNSPVGDSRSTSTGDCDEEQDVTVASSLRNVTKPASLPANFTAPPVSSNDRLVIASVAPTLHTNQFAPNNGTAKEEDLMNGVRSIYSSLMPKGSDIKAERKEENDPPAPLTTDALREQQFHPHEPILIPRASSPVGKFEIPVSGLYSSRQMERGVDVNRDFKRLFGPMASSQYNSVSIFSPPDVPSWVHTKEHADDVSGTTENVPEPLIRPRPDEKIVEGWEIKSVKSEEAQITPVSQLAIHSPSQ